MPKILITPAAEDDLININKRRRKFDNADFLKTMFISSKIFINDDYKSTKTTIFNLSLDFYMKMINTHPYSFTFFINQLGS